MTNRSTVEKKCNDCQRRHARPTPCVRCTQQHCPHRPGEANCTARAGAAADPAGTVRAICTAETLRALRAAEAAADGRRRDCVGACVGAVELAVEALEGGAALASPDDAVRLGSANLTAGSPVLVLNGMPELPTAGVVFAGRRLVDLLEHTKVNANGLSALALVHRLQPKPANLKRPYPILPRITFGAVPARERGELLLAPDGWPGLRVPALPLFPEVADDDAIVPLLELATVTTGDRAVSSGRGAAHELRLVFEVALPPGSEHGPAVDRSALREAGRVSSPAFRIGLAVPTLTWLPGRTRRPAVKSRRGQWVQGRRGRGRLPTPCERCRPSARQTRCGRCAGSMSACAGRIVGCVSRCGAVCERSGHTVTS